MELNQIYGFLKEAEQLENSYEKETEVRFQPERVEEYELPEFRIPTGQRSKASSFAKVRAMLHYCQRIRFHDGCTKMPLPTHNERFLCICGNPKGVSRMISLMEQIGIVKYTNSGYHFTKSGNKDYHRARLYFYFPENEKRFLDYCNENGIFCEEEKLMSHSVYTNTPLPTFTSFQNNQVKISSSLILSKPDNYSQNHFEIDLQRILYENYPYFNFYEKIIEESNVMLKQLLIQNGFKGKIDKSGHFDFEHQFNWNFSWDMTSKEYFVNKIGIRDTNRLCGLPKDEVKKDKDGNIIKVYEQNRKKTKKEYGLNLEYDVKSSVPRISASLLWKCWIPQEIDLYERIFDEFGSNEKFNREAIKKLFMSAYFDDDSRIGANTYFKMKSFRKEVDFQDLKKTMLDFKEATRIALGGKIFGSEIFLFESCIYARVNFELLKRGFLVWQVYDGFYARKSGVSQKEFTNLCNELVENAFYEFLEHFSSRFRLERLYI